ncbi:hypothetical protein PLICRDRAFT_78128, partial [Plicaturopsis crispa FD-325 SS-3]
LLEFVQNLFVRMPPNTTAWCDTLEAFLGNRGYKLTTRDSIRRRFGNALQWYGCLVNQTRLAVDGALEKERETMLAKEKNSGRVDDEDDNNSVPASSDTADMSPFPGIDSEEEGSEQRQRGNDEDDKEEGSKGARPSEYLRKRCPLCFGGKQCHDENAVADVIVCLDACFTQKRRKSTKGSGCKDPPQRHEDSVFMAEADVEEMARFVEGRRSRRTAADTTQDEDGYEKGMRVPTSVLNACGESFGAADEKRESASTQFFSDTGLMGLLCRHDRVL